MSWATAALAWHPLSGRFPTRGCRAPVELDERGLPASVCQVKTPQEQATGAFCSHLASWENFSFYDLIPFHFNLINLL